MKTDLIQFNTFNAETVGGAADVEADAASDGDEFFTVLGTAEIHFIDVKKQLAIQMVAHKSIGLVLEIFGNYSLGKHVIFVCHRKRRGNEHPFHSIWKRDLICGPSGYRLIHHGGLVLNPRLFLKIYLQLAR